MQLQYENKISQMEQKFPLAYCTRKNRTLYIHMTMIFSYITTTYNVLSFLAKFRQNIFIRKYGL